MLLSPEKAFTVRAGTVPILITLPHAMPLNKSYATQLEERVRGLKKTEGGLLEIVEEFTRVCRTQIGAPHVLIAEVHRSRIDFSRSKRMVAGEHAYDDPRAEPLYDAFEQTLADLSQNIVRDVSAALLLDLHGCRSRESDVYIGTLNGKTLASNDHPRSLRDDLHDLLTQRGWHVEPKPGAPEVAFMGRTDSIIARHNLAKLAAQPGRFGSLQIEISQRVRLRAARYRQFAHDLAYAALALIE